MCFIDHDPMWQADTSAKRGKHWEQFVYVTLLVRVIDRGKINTILTSGGRKARATSLKRGGGVSCRALLPQLINADLAGVEHGEIHQAGFVTADGPAVSSARLEKKVLHHSRKRPHRIVQIPEGRAANPR
jgi:hypothetical protein